LLGQRIRQDVAFQEFAKGNKSSMQDLANNLGISITTLYYSLQFFDKYPQLDTVPEGKNITWNKLKTLYLPSMAVDETPLPSNNGKYQVIYADPPWDVKAGPDWGSGEESKDLIYPTMDIDRIKELPVLPLAEDNAHLYIWTINKYIPETYDIARAWGFKPSCLLTWCKPPHGIGLGGTFVQTTEHLLFCRRGNLPASKRIDTTWFEYPRGKHSAKPQEFRKLIEEVSPGKKIELFARSKSEGWDVWGNEV